MNEVTPGLSLGASWILTIAFALVGPILSLAPLGMTPLIITTAILSVAFEGFRHRRWPRPPMIAIVLSTAFLIWCALSLMWDINPKDGARKLLDMTLIFIAALTLIGVGARVTPVQRKRLGIALIGGICIGLILLGVETMFDFPLYRVFIGGSDPKLADLVESKRSVDSLPLLVWPACLAFGVIGLGWLGILLAILFTIASFLLTAASAAFGMLVSLGIFALAWGAPKAARRALQAGTVLAFVIIIPFGIWAYDAGGTTAHWLKRSAQHRVEIWHFAAQKALDRPFFGHGLNSSRAIPNDGAVSIFLGPDKPMIPLHPHDAFLQIWLELGVVGVALTACLLLAVLNAIGKWPSSTARFALGGYAAMMVIAGLAFGIWQPWWMATLAFSAVVCAILAPEPNYG